jgi:hypothetical protein
MGEDILDKIADDQCQEGQTQIRFRNRLREHYFRERRDAVQGGVETN